MGNVMSKQRNRKNSKISKRTLKYLAVAPSNSVVRAVIHQAPDPVIRAICNGVLNARQGEVNIPNQLKPVFSKYHKQFTHLIDRKYPLSKKRHILTQQRGGILPIVAPLLGTVLASLGGEFISRIFRKNE